MEDFLNTGLHLEQSPHDIVYEELRSRSLAVKSFVNSFNPNEDRVKLSAVLEEFKSINGVLNMIISA